MSVRQSPSPTPLPTNTADDDDSAPVLQRTWFIAVVSVCGIVFLGVVLGSLRNRASMGRRIWKENSHQKLQIDYDNPVPSSRMFGKSADEMELTPIHASPSAV